MKNFTFHGWYRVVGMVLGGLGILSSLVIAAEIRNGEFDWLVFFVGILVSVITSLPFFAIDEHLDNQEIIQNQLEALAYEMHEANKRVVSKDE